MKKEVTITKTETSTKNQGGCLVTTTRFFTKKGRKFIETGTHCSFLFPDKPDFWKKKTKKKRKK